MNQKGSAKKVLAYDLGGTKVSVGVVNSRGKVLEELRVPSIFDQGKTAVFDQLTRLGKQFLNAHPEIRKVGVASAGPLDPSKGLLLDPTNFASTEGTWGITPFARLLGKRLKKPVYLENDAAAAMLAEHWIGAAKGYKDAMILTLGTGLGTGVIIDGELMRAGRNLHPEAGHMIIREGDSTAPCGCGNLGCAEAFLSGRGFSRRARARFGNPDLMAKDVADLARKRDPRALAAFEEYGNLMAVAIHNYVMMFAPEIIVFTGSFAEAADLFLESTKTHLNQLLSRRRSGIDLLPKLEISKLHNQAGLVGGAFVALNSRKQS